jgi:pimeloyl-ACP methyl ester carboxylesterase
MAKREGSAVIPVAGHTPQLERPLATAEAILAYLRGLRE